MPKSRWGDIKKAEASTLEGQKIFEELKQEYTERYLPPTKASIKDEVHNAADLEYGMEHSE